MPPIQSPLVSIRLRIVSLASMYFHLVGDGDHPDTFTVEIRAFDGRAHKFRHCGGIAFNPEDLRMTTTEESAAVPPLPLNIRLPRNARWLSPIGERILRVMDSLEAGSWLSSEKIANRLDVALNDAFKSVLGELVDRNLLESSPGRGYRLPRECKQAEEQRDAC